MANQEMTVRELISAKREIQARLIEAATVAEKVQAQNDLNELDAVLKSKLANRS